MDQILSEEKNLQESRVGYVIRPRVSDRTTSILVACQRPLDCHQCDNAAFHRQHQDGVTTLTKRPFTGQA